MRPTTQKLLKRFTKWIDPKLSKYRAKAAPYTPQTLDDFVGLIRRTPKNVLSQEDRARISAVMTFSNHRVSELMLKKEDVTFVNKKDLLGPLMLDKLYKSGYSHFPVVDSKKHVVGVLHTNALNTLAIKETDNAEKYLDPNVYYMREDYTLDQAIAAILRTNYFFFVVINTQEQLVGIITLEMIMDYLLCCTPNDNFENDSSSKLVSERH